MTYREDDSRTREKDLRENFAWLDRLTLSLLLTLTDCGFGVSEAHQ